MLFDLVSDANNEPVTLVQAKEHLKIDIDDDDAIITLYIQSARQSIERYLNISITEKQYALYLDTVTARFSIPRPPLVSVDSLTTYSAQYVATVVPATSYHTIVVNGFRESVLILKSTPSADIAPNYGWKIVFTTGYDGSQAGGVPVPIISALLNTVGFMYENRQANIESGLPPYVKSELNLYRLSTL